MTNNNIYIKYNVNVNEYSLHKYIQELEVFNVPKIIAYDVERKTMILERINQLNISQVYGKESENVPEQIFNEIREIIKNLIKYNIEYQDITGYNFIECDNKIWIVNFTNARTITGKLNNFVNKFINGLNEWNPLYM